MSLSYEVMLAYIASTNIAVGILYALICAATRTLIRALRPAEDASSHDTPKMMRRTLGWLKSIMSVLLVTFLGAALAFSVVAVVVGAVGLPQSGPLSFALLMTALAAPLVTVIVILATLLYFVAWFRRKEAELRADKRWEIWLEPGWENRTPCTILYGAWRSRLVAFAAATVLILDAAPYLYDFGRGVVDGLGDATGAEQPVDQLASIPFLASLVGVLVVVFGVTLWHPHLLLMEQSVAVLAPGRAQPGRAADELGSAPTRWRNRCHRDAYSIANSLRRTIPRFRRRLTHDQYEQVAVAAARIGAQLRRVSIMARTDHSSAEEFATLIRASVALVVANDIMRVSETVGFLMQDVNSSTVRIPSRTRLALDAGADAVQRYWPAFRVVAVFVLIALLILTEQWDKIPDLVKS